MARGNLFAPLRHRQFAQLLFGQFLSNIGDGAFLVAVVTVMVVYRNSPGDLGLVLGVRSLVALLALIFGGVMADRFRRTRVMAFTDTVRAVFIGAVAFLPASAPLPLWLIVSTVAGAAAGVFLPAYQAVIPALVPEDALEASNALRVLSQRGALILGPSVGAALLAVGGLRVVFLIDAFTFVVSLATLFGIKEPVRVETAKRRNVLRSAGQGLRAVLDRPWMAWVIGSGTLQILLILTPLTVMIPIALHARGEDSIYGVVVGLRAAGAVAGTVFAARWRPQRRGLAAMCGPLTMLALIACLIVAVPPWLMLVAAFVTGTGPALFIVYWPTALQKAVPEDLRGRVFAFDQLGAYTLQPIGLALAPLAVVAWGLTWPAIIAAISLIVTTFVPLAVPGVADFATPPRRPAPTSPIQPTVSAEEA
jgi:MFS family permease